MVTWSYIPAFSRSVLNRPRKFCSSSVKISSTWRSREFTGVLCLNPTTWIICGVASSLGVGSGAGLGCCCKSFQVDAIPLATSLPSSPHWIYKTVFFYVIFTSVYLIIVGSFNFLNIQISLLPVNGIQNLTATVQKISVNNSAPLGRTFDITGWRMHVLECTCMY